MRFTKIVAYLSVLAVASTATIPKFDWTEADNESIAAGRAYAKTLSPTSDVPGKEFDRYIQIWMENTDFDSAAADPNLAWVGKQGLTLTNYRAVAHPSQPNYISVVSGQMQGVNNGGKFRIKDRHTIVDLLEQKNISWGLYQESMPYSGFQGNYRNQQNGRNDYVRKHNPLISFDSITEDEDRLAKIKNFTMFHQDLANNMLPQWMFITPNMSHDGHDSNVPTAGIWTKEFLEPLLTNENFMNNTLLIFTFDEREKYIGKNLVYTVLLGDALPSSLRGMKDSTKYNHYSNLATVEQNWDLGTLRGSFGGAKKGDETANAFYPFFT